jgi:hypothetical protein
MKHQKFIAAGCGALALLLLASPGFAQFDRGQISGFIKDPSGAFVPGVSITVTNEGTQVAKATVTEANGFYVVPGLDVGFYNVTAELSGFKKFVKEKIKVDANAKVALDVQLEIGAQNETVTVTGQAAELQKDTAQLGRIIDSGNIENLVVFGRNPQNLVRLKAGVRGGGTSSGESNTDGGFNIAGSRSDENVVIQDGAVLTRTRSAGQIAGPLNIDTVAEVQVLTTNYAAEFGRSSGGQIRYVSKSGTKEFHGGLFHSFRNAALNANTWARNMSGDAVQMRRPSPFRYNQFGFDAGGPVMLPGINKGKDKLFFYYAQEWIRNRQEDTRTWTVPSLKMRQGDFSELLDASNRFTSKVTTIKDPTTGQPFPGNIIPTNRLSANGIGLLKSYPEPTLGFAPAGSTANFYEAVPAIRNYAKELLKVDYLPNARHRISFRGSLYQWYELGRTETANRPNRSATLSWTWTVRNNFINEANASPTIDVVHIDIAPDQLARFQKRSQYGINYPYLFPGTKVRDDKIPTINMDKISTNDGSRLPLYSAGPIYLFSDTMTWIKGTHMFKWGAVVERSGENDYDQINVSTTIPGATNNANGAFEFRDNLAKGTGLGIANAALGLFNNYGEVGRRAYTVWRATALDMFIQDSWKMRPNFTLEYGVRYVLWPPWHSLWGNIAEFDPRYYDATKRAVVNRTSGFIESGDQYNGIVLPGTAWPDAAKGRVDVASDSQYNRLFHDLPSGFAPTHKKVFEPRLGFAYSMNQKTVVRAGVGMFHNRTMLNDSTLLGGNAPIQPMSGVSEGSADAPGGSVQRRWPFLITANPYTFEHPTAWAWNLTVQRQLPWGMTIESAYVARRSYRLPRERNINQLQVGERQKASNAGANTDFLRPYSGLGIIRMSEHAGHSWYHGLQNELNRRFRNGMGFGVAYTWSKTTSNADSKRTLLPNAFDDSNMWGVSNQHRAHLFIANYVYDIPFLKNGNAWYGKVFGGWQASGIVEIQSGSPINTGDQIFGAGWRAWDQAGVGTGSGAQPYVLVGDWRLSDPQFSRGASRDSNFWFNASAFAAPAAGTYGNVGRNIITGPNQWNWDASLVKRFRITETKSFQIRADFYDFPNHPNWSNPDGNPANSSTFGRVTAKSGNRQVQITSTFRF